MVKVVSLPAYNQITEAMKENKKKVLEETAKFMMDISKLTFGGVILGGIMKQGFDPWSLYGLGALATLLAFITSLLLYNFLNR